MTPDPRTRPLRFPPGRHGAPAALLLALFLAGCVETGDFGRPKPHSTWNAALSTTGSVAAVPRQEPASPFPFTDDEAELRNRAWRFLVPAHERAWLDRALAELVATRVLPPDAAPVDPAGYHAALAGTDARSPASRYRRLSEDAAADARLLPPLAEAARRVLAADRVRLRALDAAGSIEPDAALGARARVVENRCLLAWVGLGLDGRIRAYRYALEHLTIETPQADAVPAERSLTRLGATLAVLDELDVPRLADCLGPREDGGSVPRAARGGALSVRG